MHGAPRGGGGGGGGGSERGELVTPAQMHAKELMKRTEGMCCCEAGLDVPGADTNPNCFGMG